MAIYPWIAIHERQHRKIEDFPQVKRWHDAIKARPAVERAYAKAKEINPNRHPHRGRARDCVRAERGVGAGGGAVDYARTSACARIDADQPIFLPGGPGYDPARPRVAI